jgi:hypothetical protein
MKLDDPVKKQRIRKPDLKRRHQNESLRPDLVRQARKPREVKLRPLVNLPSAKELVERVIRANANEAAIIQAVIAGFSCGTDPFANGSK